MIQKLWEVHQFGWGHVERRVLPAAPYQGKQKIYRTPGNWDMARWLARQLATHPRTSTRGSPGPTRWSTGESPSAPGSHVPPRRRLRMEWFHWIESPTRHFCADPFFFERSGRCYLFVGDYLYWERRGVIGCAKVFPAGEIGSVSTVLDIGADASYPCVFADGDDVCVIPGTLADGAVRLFRATRFPDQWSEVAVPFRGPAVDTSVWHDGALWWFFTTL